MHPRPQQLKDCKLRGAGTFQFLLIKYYRLTPDIITVTKTGEPAKGMFQGFIRFTLPAPPPALDLPPRHSSLICQALQSAKMSSLPPSFLHPPPQSRMEERDGNLHSPLVQIRFLIGRAACWFPWQRAEGGRGGWWESRRRMRPDLPLLCAQDTQVWGEQGHTGCKGAKPLGLPASR